MEELRHHCRRCRVKLPAPVSHPLDSFCTKGCFGYFFKAKCILCEGTKSVAGLACTRPKCQSGLRSKRRYGVLGKYAKRGSAFRDTGRGKSLSGNPIKIDLSEGDRGAVSPAALIGPADFPVNIIGGHRFEGAPKLPLEVRAEILRGARKAASPDAGGATRSG